MHYSRHSEAPDVFHFWTGVSVIAGALRRRVWIDQRYFTWTPNFYIVFVAPPGIATKSTTVRIGIRLLREVPGIHFGPQSLTWQAFLQALSDAREFISFGDEYYQMSCITIALTELGTFLSPDDHSLIDLMTDLWDGQDDVWKRLLKTQEKTEIVNPWVNIIACTTPSWMQRNFPEYMIGGGLTSRTIFVFADQKRRLVCYPADEIPAGDFDEHGKKLIEDLCSISEMFGEYEIDKDAKTWSKQWYENHWTNRPIHMSSERYDGYISRKQTHLHKLAMVLAAAQRDELVLRESDLKTAERFISGLEVDMAKVFENIGIADSSRHVIEILAYVRAYKSISQQDLWRLCMPVMKLQEFTDAINAGIRAGYIEQVQRAGTIYLRPAKSTEEEKAAEAS